MGYIRQRVVHIRQFAGVFLRDVAPICTFAYVSTRTLATYTHTRTRIIHYVRTCRRFFWVTSEIGIDIAHLK